MNSCPVKWGHVPKKFNYVGIDEDGTPIFCATKPRFMVGMWFPTDLTSEVQTWRYPAPENPEKAVFKRPSKSLIAADSKTDHEE